MNDETKDQKRLKCNLIVCIKLKQQKQIKTHKMDINKIMYCQEAYCSQGCIQINLLYRFYIVFQGQL